MKAIFTLAITLITFSSFAQTGLDGLWFALDARYEANMRTSCNDPKHITRFLRMEIDSLDFKMYAMGMNTESGENTAEMFYFKINDEYEMKEFDPTEFAFREKLPLHGIDMMVNPKKHHLSLYHSDDKLDLFQINDHLMLTKFRGIWVFYIKEKQGMPVSK